MAESSQKFIARNRAPRVQIEYDVELYGAEKKVQLPFVMGVMSDLSGSSEEPLPAVADRKFLEIDVDNFDDRMKSMKPRAAFTVPNTLTGEGNLAVDITFESMDDFSPAAIARKVEPLRKLLEARTQLSNLMTYMDGKAGAEELIEQVLGNAGLLHALAGNDGLSIDRQATLAGLRQLSSAAPAAPAAPAAVTDATGGILAGLRAAVPGPAAVPDLGRSALEALRAAPVVEPDGKGSARDPLAALRSLAPAPDQIDGIGPATVLDALRGALIPPVAQQDAASSAALAALRALPETPVAQEPGAEAALAALRSVSPGVETNDGSTAAALAGLRSVAVEPVATTGPDVAAALGALRTATVSGDGADSGADTLAALRSVPVPQPVEPPSDISAAALAALRTLPAFEPPEVQDASALALAALRSAAPEVGESRPEDALAALAGFKLPLPDMADLLGGVLDSLRESRTDGDAPAEDLLAAALSGAKLAEQSAAPDSGDLSAILSSIGADEVAAPADLAASILDGLLIDPQREDPDQAAQDLLSAITRSVVGGNETGPEEGSRSADTLETGAGLDDLLASLEGGTGGAAADIDSLLGDLEGSAEESPGDGGDALDDLMAGLEAGAEDLDSLLGDLDGSAEESPGEGGAAQDDLMAGLEAGAADLDSLLGDLEDPGAGKKPDVPADAAGADGLDDLLALLGQDAVPAEVEGLSDLDSLLADLGAAEAVPADTGVDDLDALLAGLSDQPLSPEADPFAGLDDLMGGPAPSETLAQTTLAEDAMTASPKSTAQAPFGTLTAPRPTAEQLRRKTFRMAVFGDFTGRAARGLAATGDKIAAARAIKLDIDTVEQVIEGFATRLILPIGQDGTGIEVKLRGLDDLHPDELHENVEMFSSLVSLRQRLSSSSLAPAAIRELTGWGAEFTEHARAPHRTSAGSAVPADRKLSDFQTLIGDTEGRLSRASSTDDLIARVIGPYVLPSANPQAAALKAVVDQALSAAMRLVLHHPEFQAIESQWRSLDLLARRIETDEKLEIVLYDISAEELAADLAAQEDLARSGFYRLLSEEPLAEEAGTGAFSALFGLYTFEETPPHAELLARIARVASHVDAPFFTALSPAFLETPKKDRHPLVAQAWDHLRSIPEARHLGLASPRFLLRRPYGARSEPTDAFDFEEFTPSEGLSGMLWANPVVLVAILLAQTRKKGGARMQLGQVMSLGEMPFHFVKDQHGDQVALPCTERNLTTSKTEMAVTRGLMPVISIRGRDQVRLGSFQSLAGSEILGPWAEASGVPAAPAPKSSPLDVQMDLPAPATDAAMEDLDALLASFGDISAPSDPADIDAELAALLEGL